MTSSTRASGKMIRQKLKSPPPPEDVAGLPGEPDEDEGSDDQEDSASPQQGEDDEQSPSETSQVEVQDSPDGDNRDNEAEAMALEGEDYTLLTPQDTMTDPGGEGKSDGENPEAKHRVDNTQELLDVLRGRMERNHAEMSPYPGGSPRRWQRKDRLQSVEEHDPVEYAMWCRDPLPALPRSVLRERCEVGGELAIVRDISGSMTGMQARWASSVVRSLVLIAKEQRMKIGYCEFNHLTMKHTFDGKFFVPSRSQKALEDVLDAASGIHCHGFTNYEAPLSEVLEEFETHAMAQRRTTGKSSDGSLNRHILFLTDGIPTQGSATVLLERKLAQRLGVAVHTVFIGSSPDYPKVLDHLAVETEGVQFQALPFQENIQIVRREHGDKASFVKARQAIAENMKTSRV